jgi:hypothetical protein
MNKVFIWFVFAGLTGWVFGAIRWISTYQDISYGIWAFALLSIVSYMFYYSITHDKK